LRKGDRRRSSYKEGENIVKGKERSIHREMKQERRRESQRN